MLPAARIKGGLPGAYCQCLLSGNFANIHGRCSGHHVGSEEDFL